ncbi:MAG: hypothetical protein Q9222_003898 [Ikaeria aurantiellina]
MIAPETPSKADDEIRRITLDLSAKWGLKFPPAALQSPAKRDLERPEEKVLSRLQYLYFYDKRKNQAATKYAINCFEHLAPKLLAGWVGKPYADTDVLPVRTRSEAARRAGYLTRRPTLSDEQTSDLMLALLRYLDEAIEGVRKNAIFSPDEASGRDNHDAGHSSRTPKHREGQSTRRSPRTSSEKRIDKQSTPRKNGNIRNYFQQKLGEPSLLLQSDHSAGLDLPLDNDAVGGGLFEDVGMHDAMEELASSKSPARRHAYDITMHSPESNESLEDYYQTPPDSPSKIYEKPQMAQRSKDPIPLPKLPSQAYEHGSLNDNPFVQGKKRTLPHPQKPEMPRKISRDTSSRRSAAGIVDQSPTKPSLIGIAGAHGANSGNRSLQVPLHQSFSTESFASVSSSALTVATSAWTSPNTSFRTETPATSFDSSTEPFELDEYSDRKVHTRQSWQNLKEPFGLGLDLIANLVDYDNTTAASMGPPMLSPANNRVSTVSVKDLLSDSPFGERQ